MSSRPSFFAKLKRELLGPGREAQPPRVVLEGVRTVPQGVLRVTAVLLLAGTFAFIQPVVVAWFVIGPLLAAALFPGGVWAVLVAVGIIGASLGAVDAGGLSVVFALTLPLSVHFVLLSDAASRSDLRHVGVDVRLVVRALRSTLLVACVLVPVILLVSFVDLSLPPWLGLLGVVGILGLAVVTVRLTSSSRAR